MTKTKLLSLTAAMLLPLIASATLITEYFNNYGTADADLVGLGSAGAGWAGAWSGTGSDTEFDNAVQLTFTSTGYSTFGNETDINDGRANRTGGGTFTSRSFTDSISSGTVWMSALIRSDATATTTSGSTFGDALPDRDTQLRINADTDVIFGEYNANPYLTTGTDQFYGDPFIQDASKELDRTATYLVILKIDLTAGADSISYWVADENDNNDFDADTTLQTEAGLGSALLTSNSTDIGTITGLAIYFNKQGQADVLRFSTTPGDAGLQEVLTGVPEPSTFAAIAGLLGLVVVMMRRRR